MCQPPVTLYSRPWSRMTVDVQCCHSSLQRTNLQIWPCNMSLGNDYQVPAAAAAAAAKSLQSCPALCKPIDGSPPGSPVPGTLQARTLEWVAISFSNAWKWKWSHSVVSDSSWPPWTAAFQATLSMGFSRQEYWSGVPSPSPTRYLQCAKCYAMLWG